MTYNEFLDNEKSRGRIVYACLNCTFRGIGASTTYHEINNPTHELVNEEELDKFLMSKLYPNDKRLR
jgi:hypothetical protein